VCEATKGASNPVAVYSHWTVDFDIHYHVEKSVAYPAQLAQTASSKGMLATTVAQDYCWMWLNKSKATIELQTSMKK
jgi:hypothetical protein